MIIHTTYFANLRNIPRNMVPIAICRGLPAWYSGLAYEKLAPTYDILMEYKLGEAGGLAEDQYINRYRFEILSELDVDEVYETLLDMAGGKPFCLVCYEKSDDFCHRHIVADWFNNNGYECEEFINK